MSNKIEYLKATKILLPITICIAVIMMIFLPYMYHRQQEVPKPESGVLDLSEWDYEKGQPSLNGGWEFYWSSLYTYRELLSMPHTDVEYINVPGTWNSVKLGGKALSGFGYGTYRIKIIVKDEEQILSIQLNNIATAYRLYVNDMELVSGGTVGKNSNSTKPSYKLNTVTFKPPAKEFFLILQVSNFSYARGGIWYSINMGTPEQIDSESSIIVYKGAILTGSLLIMALFYASFYIVLRREKSCLCLVLLCMIFILRTSIYGDVFIVRLFPSIPFRVIVYFMYSSLHWLILVLFLMIDSLYSKYISKRVKKAIVIYGISATVITAILPLQIYSKFIFLIEAIGMFSIIYLTLRVVVAYLHDEKGTILIFTALFSILATALYDILYHASILSNSFGELMPIGIFLLMFVFAFILAQRLFDAYARETNLSRQLEHTLKEHKKASEELIKTEMSFLKAQIKPHFLFNSLSVIIAVITKDPLRATKLLYNLSDYLRGSFNFENYNCLTPIVSELATVRAYLSIEKERFQGKLNVKYDIDQSIDISIPMLTIQPLVENAIRHGIMKKSGDGVVKVSVQKAEGCTVIAIADDGAGISGLRLSQIFTNTEIKAGIGLKNIQRRLILHYGHGLEIQSEEGRGTTVMMKIPDTGRVTSCEKEEG